MDDIGDISFESELRMADATAANGWPTFEFEWWSRVLETRSVAAFGRSRLLCVVASILFHLAIFLLLVIDWSGFGGHESHDLPSVVPVELVTVGDETNMAAMTSRLQPPTPSVQHGEAAASTKPETTPSFEMKLFPTKPSDQPKAATPKTGEADSKPDGKPASRPKDAKVGDYDIAKVGQGTAMTMSVSDFLRNQIALCWRRAGNAEPEVVVFELYLDGSGAIERPPALIEPSAQTPSAIAAAESVRHAIYTCAPYRLPAERYQQWHQITLTFDPRLIRGADRH